MVEAGAKEVSEEIMVEALMLAHKEINRLCRWQKELYKALDIQKRPVEAPALNEEMLGEIERNYAERLRQALNTEALGKIDSYAAVDALEEGGRRVLPRRPARAAPAGEEDFRPPQGEDLPRGHPRQAPPPGQPQVQRDSPHRRARSAGSRASTARRSSRAARRRPSSPRRSGTKEDEQFMDDLESGEIKRRFLLHYNFPHYSVGEVGRFGSTSRREIGHGALARRALEPVLPDRGRVPVLAPHRLGHHGVERLVVDGDRLRRLALDDGRGRAD